MPAPNAYALPGLVTVLALLVTQATALVVGRSRQRHGVMPPQMGGPPAFERALRVQQNTLEQVVIMLPALWVAVMVSNPLAASLVGAIWVVGRIAYAVGYLQAAEQRTVGFVLSFLASTVLLVMALVGSLVRLL